MRVDVRVDGKVGLVTGASRGIGLAIARELLDSGAEGVVITGRKPDSLDPVAEELGERCVGVAGNVSDPDHVAEAVGTAVERFGSCDLLVNNAGTNPAAGALTDVDMGAVDKTWEINQRAPLLWVREAYAQSMAERGGSILNIGSVGGMRPSPVIGAYNVSKAALHHITHQLAHELAPKVRVNALAAAVVRTKLSELLWSTDEEGAVARHPMNRLGEPEDVARAATFLLSDAASWITGVIMPVDGGSTGA